MLMTKKNYVIDFVDILTVNSTLKNDSLGNRPKMGITISDQIFKSSIFF